MFELNYYLTKLQLKKIALLLKKFIKVICQISSRSHRCHGLAFI